MFLIKALRPRPLKRARQSVYIIVFPGDRWGTHQDNPRIFHLWIITSLLITRFFFPTPEMKARDQAVQKRHRNQESVEWLQRYCMIRSDRSSQNEDQIVPNRLISLYFHSSLGVTTSRDPFKEEGLQNVK